MNEGHPEAMSEGHPEAMSEGQSCADEPTLRQWGKVTLRQWVKVKAVLMSPPWGNEGRSPWGNEWRSKLCWWAHPGAMSEGQIKEILIMFSIELILGWQLTLTVSTRRLRSLWAWTCRLRSLWAWTRRLRSLWAWARRLRSHRAAMPRVSINVTAPICRHSTANYAILRVPRYVAIILWRAWRAIDWLCYTGFLKRAHNPPFISLGVVGMAEDGLTANGKNI